MVKIYQLFIFLTAYLAFEKQDEQKEIFIVIALRKANTMKYTHPNAPDITEQANDCLIDVPAIIDLFNQQGCAGMRIYFALKSNHILTTVLVGTNNMGEDITTGILLDDLVSCPPNCPTNSPLM